jgi:hypothetical protein
MVISTKHLIAQYKVQTQIVMILMELCWMFIKIPFQKECQPSHIFLFNSNELDL